MPDPAHTFISHAIAYVRSPYARRIDAPHQSTVVAGTETGDAAEAVIGITYWRSPIERYELSRAERGWTLEAVRVLSRRS